MIPVPTWTLYYEDGTWFSSIDGEPYQSPVWGAVMVTQYDREPRACQNDPFLIHRTDQDQWYGCDHAGLLDQLSHFSHVIDCVRVGRWMPSENYRQVRSQANEELKAIGLLKKGIIK